MSCVETWMLNCEQVRDDISVRVQFGAWRELSGSGRGFGGKEGAGGCSGEVGCSAQRDAALERAAPPLLPRAATSLPAAALVAW